MQLIESLGAQVTAVTIALDRQEKGQGERSAVQERGQLGVRVIPIIRLADILQYLQDNQQTEDVSRVRAYRVQYGID